MPRVKNSFRTADKQLYKDFRKEYPHRKISFSEYYNIIHSFSNYFREYILETGHITRLGAGLGDFTIRKFKPEATKIDENGNVKIRLHIDWKKTQEKGKKIYHMNYDTDGYVAAWKWIKDSAIISNRRVWFFVPSRTTKRLLPHYIRADKSCMDKYIEWQFREDKHDFIF